MKLIHATVVARKGNKYYMLRVHVIVALGIYNAMHMRHIVICGLPSSAVSFHIIS
jgi:hypothetical protein